MSNEYDNTLNLPKTDFQMRASLPQREPDFLAKWDESDLYGQMLKKNAGRPLYLLHDGPPYANGDIHIGHALNKILKDFVVRYKNMNGYCSPYIPGWDTHGLPIERQAMQKLGLDRASVSPVQFRQACREFALKYVDNQREQFKRLGVTGQWDDPYLTLSPEYEARQIELFGEMAKKGYIYKGLRPVYWCPHDETALAEAEIEYEDEKVDSIYVKFRVTDDKGLLSPNTGGLPVYVVIWTTTTWTLPGNVAVCVGPDYEYVLVKAKDEVYLMARALVERVMKAAGIADYMVLDKVFSGSQLEYMKTRHPFLERDSLVIVGEHVTLESGTGIVHTAPGHGLEDFIVCQSYKELPIPVPVDSKGVMTDEAGPFSGLSYGRANTAILTVLKESGALMALERLEHSYPHCWRCKNPVLFRATEQWFCSVEGFRDEAVRAVRGVRWIPQWGEERITSMILDRNDWCISRQRIWGVPIPIFYCEECGRHHINDATIKAVSKLFRTEGSDAWYSLSAKEILGGCLVCECGSQSFRKETDIMDVWFDSGTSHTAVLESREGLCWPCDLYLEGNDQYRGWFQSSLLTAVAWRGVPPYRTVLTHGFVVDKDGKKMSKSLGNVVDPQKVIKQYGADILRLWVSSVDYRMDVRISDDMLKQLSEIYRKIRNTARFILGNLYDFYPEKHLLPYEKLTELDRWALMKLNGLVRRVTEAYESFEYHVIFHTVHNFCVVELSNFYLDVIKDRLYVEKAGGDLRRAAQTAMYLMLDALVRILAPILCFTAEDIWRFMPGRVEKSVFLAELPKLQPCYDDAALEEKWDGILRVREDVKKELEKARAARLIGSSLDAKAILYATGETYAFLRGIADELPDAFIVSAVELCEGGGEGASVYDCPGLAVEVAPAGGEKCERCWKYAKGVGDDPVHSTLCPRCAGVIDGSDLTR